MKKSLVLLVAASMALVACNKEQKGKGGLLYTIHKDAGNTKIKEGDFIKIDFIQKNDKDSILDATYDHDMPRYFPVAKKQYSGDMNDVLTMFGEGDSATFKVNIDTMLFYNKQPRPEQFKDMKYLTYTVKIQKVIAKKDKEVDSVFQKRVREYYDADFKDYLAKRKAAEPAKMKKYAEDHDLKLTTTKTGLQYEIKNPGTGDKPLWGDTAVVDYTGQLTFPKVNGDKMNVFDTSIEKIAKEHMTPNPMKQYAPVPFPLGEGLAKGFVEALQLIGKGGKITVIMPSSLAYGDQGGGPIPPYAPLVFDIEVKDIKKSTGAAIPPAPVAPTAPTSKK